MKLEEIRKAAGKVLALLQDYQGKGVGASERSFDPILYSYLQGRFGNVARQQSVYLYGNSRPQRIDFRYGTSNPVFIELAVRPEAGGGVLSGAQNAKELRKLCRMRNSKARLRVLLLIDRHPNALVKDDLEQTYGRITSGPGNFERRPVRVLYVHRDVQFDFVWRACQGPKGR
ncbi:MAG: hypothetical protein HY673_05135 [Chloroflexi bacterium]|nr:hypothetical protein [Chloroflexota bacterium]